ncbi:MAG TPA: L-aspartate oxidase [Bacillota bacterium]
MNEPPLPAPPLPVERYARPLLPSETLSRLPRQTFDVVVVGAGIAGLTFVLHLPPDWRVALLTKGALGESNTRYAQGGLSAAIGPDDSPELHEADTLAAGAGLCDPDAVRALVAGAPAAVAWLIGLGARFDRDPATGDVALGREAAHSRRRVLHAGGDATGAEIERALVAAVRARPGVTVFEHAFALDLIVESGRCHGVVAELSHGGASKLTRLAAGAVAIAAGGIGQLWAVTSNPPGATADGLAMALRAGVAVADLEFVQFHPTVLALPGAAPFLISEAVRGEGAYLRGRDGARFMTELHPLAELAPRDVVARGIQRQMARDGADHVYLDLRHLDAEAVRARFPTIARALAARGLDLATDLIPVAPAAHYAMGGIVAGTNGATSLPGLLAIGEASCTGVHGANRLASNSLLEGLVFGIEAALHLAAHGLPQAPTVTEASGTPGSPSRRESGPPLPLAALRSTLQRTMSQQVGVIRDDDGLRGAASAIDAVLRKLPEAEAGGRDLWELWNIALAASAIVTAATLRQESRGAHYRSDFPEPDHALAGCHLAFGGPTGPRWRYATLRAARGA